MQAWSRRLLPVLALVVAVGCTPAAPTPSPLPSFRCTPEAGGAEFDCSQAQYDEMVAKDALYAEAEAVYRKYLAEHIRILRAGGLGEPTEVLQMTTSGEFLSDAMVTYRDYAARQIEASGEDPQVLSLERAPGRAKTGSLVSMTSCVDARTLTFSEADEYLGRGTLARDENYFARIDGVLKLIGVDGEQVEEC